jgi:CheY-like chemotaxis protein
MEHEPKNKTVLVIDDSTTNVVLLQAILLKKGYEIQTALSVKEAYTVMAKKLPDLILLDLLMPRINGYDFLKEIKSNNAMQSIPVVVVSALTDQENVKKTMEFGAHSFVKKPVEIQNLVDLVDSILFPIN